MKKALLVFGFLLIASSAYAQNPNVSCTDATATNCTIKKNGSFQLTADVYTDPLALKMRVYVDGVKNQEIPVVQNTAPLFSFATGLSALGDHTLYMEAVGSCPSPDGLTTVECATAGTNSVTVHIVNGNPKAPTGVKIIK